MGGGVDSVDHRFRPKLVRVVFIWKGSWCGDGTYPPRVARALRTAGYDFHTVKDGVDPGDKHFSSPVCLCCRCMEEFLIRGCDVIVTGWLWLCEYQVGVYTPWGAVSTRGANAFVDGLLEL